MFPELLGALSTSAPQAAGLPANAGEEAPKTRLHISTDPQRRVTDYTAKHPPRCAKPARQKTARTSNGKGGFIRGSRNGMKLFEAAGTITAASLNKNASPPTGTMNTVSALCRGPHFCDKRLHAMPRFPPRFADGGVFFFFFEWLVDVRSRPGILCFVRFSVAGHLMSASLVRPFIFCESRGVLCLIASQNAASHPTRANSIVYNMSILVE